MSTCATLVLVATACLGGTAGASGVSLPASLAADTFVAPLASDTVVDLARGESIVVENLSGRLTVEAWDADRLEVRGAGRAATPIVRRRGTQVVVGAADRAVGRRTDVVLRVPVWADVQIEGIDLEVDLRGLGGAVRVHTVTGGARVDGTTGRIEVRTVEGEIVATRASGELVLSAQGDDVRVTDATGPVDVSSGAGDLVLERVRAPSVRAETQAGDITFSGALEESGTYGFFVHAGDVVLGLPPDTRADVRMSTFDGELRSDFPVVVPSYRSGRAIEFAIGGGGAAVRIEVFSGEIRLVRGGG